MALGEEERRGQIGVGGLDYLHGRKLVVDVRVVRVVVAVLVVAVDVDVAASAQDGINGGAVGFLVSEILVVVVFEALNIAVAAGGEMLGRRKGVPL